MGTGKGLEVGYARGPRERLLISSCVMRWGGGENKASCLFRDSEVGQEFEERNSNLDELRGLAQESSTQKHKVGNHSRWKGKMHL